jgi:hypothetical protein
MNRLNQLRATSPRFPGPGANAVRLAIFIWSLLLLPQRTFADEKDAAEQVAIQKFNSIADTEARGFQVSYMDSQNIFDLVPQPLQTWTNPVSGSIRGRVYVWTQDGIPILLASVYKYDEQSHVSSEFHALARRPIAGKSGSGERWEVRSPSVEFRNLPNTPKPATSRSARLAQMREIARRFSASRIDPDKSNWDLRLLSQPLYRYPEKTKNNDGALFVFVQGTNPDVILLIEANDPVGNSEWKYALARMHRYELKVHLDGSQIHQFPALSSVEVVDKSKPYTVFRTQLPNLGK